MKTNNKTITFVYQSLQQLRDIYGDVVDEFIQNNSNNVLLQIKQEQKHLNEHIVLYGVFII